MKSIKKNTVLNTLKTIAAIVFPLISLPYVSRILLPDNVGKVNFAISFVGYFALIASLGISTYAIRECSKCKEDNKKLSDIASQIFSINCITTVCAYALLGLALIIFRSLDKYRYLILIYSSIIVFTTIGMDWLNASMEDFLYISIRTILFQVLSLALMFVLVRTAQDFYKYIAIVTISSSGANILNFFYRRRYCSVKLTFKIDWKRHLAPIMFLFVMSLSQTIFNNADITMLGLMKDDFEVGLYSTAHKVTNVVGQVVQSVIFVMIPRLSYFFSKNDYDSINKLLKKLLQFNVGLGFPITIGIIVLSDDIVFAIGGADYMGSGPILSILILSFFFSLIGGSFLGNAILIPSGKEKYYMIVCCITAVLNVILNLFLIPLKGAIGAAISTAFNGFIIMVLLLLKRNTLITIKGLTKIFIPPVLGCFVIVVVCFLCKQISNIWIRTGFSVLLSVLSYLVVLLSFKYDLLVDTLVSFYKKVKRR